MCVCVCIKTEGEGNRQRRMGRQSRDTFPTPQEHSTCPWFHSTWLSAIINSIIMSSFTVCESFQLQMRKILSSFEEGIHSPSMNYCSPKRWGWRCSLFAGYGQNRKNGRLAEKREREGEMFDQLGVPAETESKKLQGEYLILTHARKLYQS